MTELGRRAKDLLKETISQQLDQILPYNDEGVRVVLQECAEHADLIKQVASGVHDSAGIGEDAEDPGTSVDWQQYPQDGSALLVHHACICRNKRCLLAYLNERSKRMRHVWWQKRRLPPEMKAHLSPSEELFYKDYDDLLRKYMSRWDGVDLDVTTDVHPPKDPCVQVRCGEDAGEFYLSVGKVNLRKNSVHYLPLADAEPLLKSGVLERMG